MLIKHLLQVFEAMSAETIIKLLTDVGSFGFGKNHGGALAEQYGAYFAFKGTITPRTLFFFVLCHNKR